MLKRQLSGFVCLLLLLTVVGFAQQKTKSARTGSAVARRSAQVPADLLLRFLRLADERNLNDEELTKLLFHSNAAVRARAALALGRIGDKRATTALLTALEKDAEESVRLMSAFALGEMEDNHAVATLIRLLASARESLAVRARMVEALGKIASLPTSNTNTAQPSPATVNATIIRQLPEAKTKLSPEQKLMTSLTITALLRLRQAASVETLVQLLSATDADVRAQAANALYRLRLPLTEALPALLVALADKDPVVRANAARALGQSKDTGDINLVRRLYQSFSDPHDQVRANAARGMLALAASDNQLARETLLAWSRTQSKAPGHKSGVSALELEIAAGLGTLKDKRFVDYLLRLRAAAKGNPQPEIETALARLDEQAFLTGLPANHTWQFAQWRQVAAIAQGLGEISAAPGHQRLVELLKLTETAKLDERAVPALLRALARHRPDDLSALLREKLKHKDLFIRGAAAALLSGSLNDENLAALVSAFAQAKPDAMNDAKLALLTALARYNDERAVSALRSALADDDHLVRRRASELLQQKGEGNAAPIGIVSTQHDDAFYQRVLRRSGTKPVAIIQTRRGQTKRGRITLQLFADDAPLTVENFIALARRGYFNGLTFHRVVPNFVIQGGDPRGDGEGGPGYQIRCEINLRPYQRGTVGMALSGKDTGGSQWFITHSPQPHLDGGYTVFGQVTTGMHVVDQIARDDVIERITIREAGRR